MGPQMALYDSTHTNLVSSWNRGKIKAQEATEVLEVNLWNNKGGSSDVSDLKEAYITVLDSEGDTANDDVARDGWIQVNEPSVDGDQDTFTPIGGALTKDIKANSALILDYTISGAANDGEPGNDSDGSGCTKNFATLRFRAVAPPNSNPGEKTFKIRLSGYFT